MNAAFISHGTNTGLRQFVINARRTLNNFANALFAAQNRQSAFEENRTDILALAQQYEQHSPGFSNELRAIASKG